MEAVSSSARSSPPSSINLSLMPRLASDCAGPWELSAQTSDLIRWYHISSSHTWLVRADPEGVHLIDTRIGNSDMRVLSHNSNMSRSMRKRSDHSVCTTRVPPCRLPVAAVLHLVLGA